MQSYKFMFGCHLKKFRFPIFVCSSHFVSVDCERFDFGRKCVHILVTAEATYRCVIGRQQMLVSICVDSFIFTRGQITVVLQLFPSHFHDETAVMAQNNENAISQNQDLIIDLCVCTCSLNIFLGQSVENVKEFLANTVFISLVRGLQSGFVICYLISQFACQFRFYFSQYSFYCRSNSYFAIRFR